MIHFFDANRIVFVDDGDDAQGKEAGEGVAGIVEAGGVFDYVAGQQQLRHDTLVVAEYLRIEAHHRHLTDAGYRLLAWHFRWSLRQAEDVQAKAHRAG